MRMQLRICATTDIWNFSQNCTSLINITTSFHRINLLFYDWENYKRVSVHFALHYKLKINEVIFSVKYNKADKTETLLLLLWWLFCLLCIKEKRRTNSPNVQVSNYELLKLCEANLHIVFEFSNANATAPCKKKHRFGLNFLSLFYQKTEN